MNEAAGASPIAGERRFRLLLLALWAGLVLFLAWHHVPWRDEVRAFSIALQGDTTLDMLRGLQGEGHPAIWYLLLRLGHLLVPVREVLPGIAFLIAAASMAILVLKAPLRLPLIALFMLGGLGLSEYAVSARNYGISMLVLFVIAALYQRNRDRGVLLGLLLFLLCNTNVPACFLAAAFLGFWLLELWGDEGFRWSPKYGWWLANSAIAAAGAAVCFVTVFPTVNDAASIDHPAGITLESVLSALTTPSLAFGDLAAPWLLGMEAMGLIGLLLVGSLAGLLRAPAAFVAGLVVLLFFLLFFQLVYPGSYRHQGLLVVFLLTLYWLVAAGRGGRWPDWWPRIRSVAEAVSRVGTYVFGILLALQLAHSSIHYSAAFAGVPYSRAADLAALLEREGLGESLLIADPDVMLEPLPYHVDNPTYLFREQKFGRVVRFTKEARLDIRLDDILAEAQRLSAETGRPAVIVLQHRLAPNAPPKVLPEPYVGRFFIDPDQVRRFLGSTRKLASFGPALTDETYDVYLLNPAPSG